MHRLTISFSWNYSQQKYFQFYLNLKEDVMEYHLGCREEFHHHSSTCIVYTVSKIHRLEIVQRETRVSHISSNSKLAQTSFPRNWNLFLIKFIINWAMIGWFNLFLLQVFETFITAFIFSLNVSLAGVCGFRWVFRN